MYEQATIPVQDEKSFGQVRAAIERSFAPAAAAGFLQRIERERLRAREFEAILERGLLGIDAANGYRNLGDGDRGQIREFYLRQVELVPPELRAKYLKAYAYY
jgi:hypothetical protein